MKVDMSWHVTTRYAKSRDELGEICKAAVLLGFDLTVTRRGERQGGWTVTLRAPASQHESGRSDTV